MSLIGLAWLRRDDQEVALVEAAWASSLEVTQPFAQTFLRLRPLWRLHYPSGDTHMIEVPTVSSSTVLS